MFKWFAIVSRTYLGTRATFGFNQQAHIFSRVLSHNINAPFISRALAGDVVSIRGEVVGYCINNVIFC